MNAEEIRKAIEGNGDYWQRRALESKLNIIENEEDYVRRISAIYDKANKEIEEKLAAVYGRYAKENKMTLEEAYKILPKKMELEYKKDVMDYIEKAKSGDVKWKQYLLNQSIMHKHSVLDQLRTEYRRVIYEIDMETTGGKFLEKIFTNSNYHAQYSNGEENFARVDKDRIQRLLQENWSGGGNFSELIWKNKEQLVNALDDIVIRGLATGESFDAMSDKLSKRMETSKGAAKRLIMTESARMDNEGLLDYYKRTDVTHLEFIATLDMKTSDICRAMDGEIIPIENAQIGLNVPPLHPYCRSVVAPVYEDELEDGEIDREKRAYRDKETNKTKVGDYKNYAEYVEKEIGDKKQAEAIISTKNDLRTLIKAVGTSTISPTIQPEPYKNLTDEEFDYYSNDCRNTINEEDVKAIDENYLHNLTSNPINRAVEKYGDEVFEHIDELGNKIVDTIKSLDNATRGYEIPENITTNRFVLNNYIEAVYGKKILDVDFNKIDVNKYSSFEQIYAERLNAKFKDSIIESGRYLSTSTSIEKNLSKNLCPIMMRIKVDKGFTGYFSGNVSESELILPRGTRLQLTNASVENTNGYNTLILDYKVVR